MENANMRQRVHVKDGKSENYVLEIVQFISQNVDK